MEYLKKLGKEELLILAYFNHDEKYDELVSKDMDDVYSYVVEHLDSICSELSRFIVGDVIEDLNYYFDDNDEYEFDEIEYHDELRFDTISFLESLSLMSKKRRNGSIKVRVEKEFIDHLDFDYEDESYLDIYYSLLSVLDTYGVIDIHDLDKVIDGKDIEYVVKGFAKLYQSFHIYEDLVCHSLFTHSSKAHHFYKSIPEQDFHIKRASYQNLASYKRLMKYMKDVFLIDNIDSDYMEYFEETFSKEFLDPCLTTMQVSEDDAISDLAENLSMIITYKDKEFDGLVLAIEDLFSNIPKWKLGGKVK